MGRREYSGWVMAVIRQVVSSYEAVAGELDERRALDAHAVAEVVMDAVRALRRRIRDGPEIRWANAARRSIEPALVPARDCPAHATHASFPPVPLFLACLPSGE